MSLTFILKTLFITAVIAVPLLLLLKSEPEGENPYGPPGKPLGFLGAVSSYFANYANFNGRASRSEYWYAMLFFEVLFCLFMAIDRSEIIAGLLSIACLLPNLAVATRRLHDINRIGGYQAVAIAFPIGTLIAIYWYCKAPSEQSSPVQYPEPA